MNLIDVVATLGAALAIIKPLLNNEKLYILITFK